MPLMIPKLKIIYTTSKPGVKRTFNQLTVLKLPQSCPRRLMDRPRDSGSRDVGSLIVSVRYYALR